MQLTLQPKQVARSLLAVVMALTAIHSIVLFFYFYIPDEEVYGLVDLFDFDIEGNIPTLYSACAMLFSASLLWFIARLPQRDRDGSRGYWLGMSFVMAFLAIDEGTMIHEGLSSFLEDYMVAEGFFYFLWVVPYGLATIVLAAVYLRFLGSLPARTRKLFILAGSLFLGGAIGIEMFGARAADLYGTASISYCVLYTFEEFFEMAGIVLFIYGLLTHVAWEGEALSITMLPPLSKFRTNESASGPSVRKNE
jgi:hypothetical protein